VLLDLEELGNPRRLLRDLGVLMNPSQVLVLRAAGTMPREEIEQLGFRVIDRPAAVKDIVKALRLLISGPPEAAR
jgi:hypothetical protein